MIVADTSALISLAAAGVLETVLAEFDVHTTENVITELENTAEYDDSSGVAASTVLEQAGRLAIHDVEMPGIGSSKIDDGEESCVALAQQADTEFILTDDLRALPEIEVLVDARVAISPIVLRALVKRGVLTEENARERVEEMSERRSWLGAPIYRRALKLFED